MRERGGDGVRRETGGNAGWGVRAARGRAVGPGRSGRGLALLLVLSAGAACRPDGARWPAQGPSSGAAAPLTRGAVPVLPLPPELAPPPCPGREARLTLGAVGDVMFQAGVQESASAAAAGDTPVAGYEALFAPVADELAAPDLLFANLETPVAPRDGRARATAFSFNAPLAAAQALQRVGVDVVNVANNHIFDRKRRGMLQTLANLEALGMEHVGAGPTPHEPGPRMLEVRGLRVAFLAWTQVLNRNDNACAEPGCPRVAILRDWGPAEEAVRAAAAEADAVVVSLHWGQEYAPSPGPGEVALARRLVEAGARVVLGHHPHVLQPLELHRRSDGTVGLIAYSLGNFISNQARGYRPGAHPASTGDPRDGVLLRVELARCRALDGRPPGAQLTGVDALPLWTDHAPGQVPSIRVVALPRVLEDVRAGLGSPAAWSAGGQMRREQLYGERLARIRERVGASFTRVPWPGGAPPVVASGAASGAEARTDGASAPSP